MDKAITLPLTGIRVLVVEDNEDMRELLVESLRLLDATVVPVATAREAVVEALRADIIVTDVALPMEDGVWLWERVNLHPHPIPVIALSGYTADQYPRMKHAQFARTLLKPIDPNKLAGVISEVLDGR